MLRLVSAFLFAAALSGCASLENYTGANTPRYAGDYGAPREVGDTIRVVTMNIEHGELVYGAIAAVASHADLRSADVLAIQEVHAAGADSLARALSMNYVHYPSSYDADRGRDDGEAILSPWEIEDDGKLVLPHRSRGTGRRRSATFADLRIGERLVRAYSVHFSSPLAIDRGQRRDQADAILTDSALFPGPVIIAGDFNSEEIGEYFVDRGHCWPTKSIEDTVHRFSLGFAFDHVVARGLCVAEGMDGGVAADADDVGDHLPVWAVLVPEPATDSSR
jgi:endonuclease/exonuclease/phosphatase family metal-dependent hydrolase